MSSTNRGKRRNDYDLYYTPTDVVENLLKHIDLSNYGNKVLEPSAGKGNICSVIKGLYPDKNITSVEIREEEKQNLLQYSDKVIIGDYMKIDTQDRYDIILGNPPYSSAMEFVNKSLQVLSDNGVLIMLLRTAFLESKARYSFWQDNPLSKLYVLSRRPSFTGKGTDSASYSWFIWDRTATNQIIKVI